MLWNLNEGSENYSREQQLAEAKGTFQVCWSLVAVWKDRLDAREKPSFSLEAFVRKNKMLAKVDTDMSHPLPPQPGGK